MATKKTDLISKVALRTGNTKTVSKPSAAARASFNDSASKLTSQHQALKQRTSSKITSKPSSNANLDSQVASARRPSKSSSANAQIKAIKRARTGGITPVKPSSAASKSSFKTASKDLSKSISGLQSKTSRPSQSKAQKRVGAALRGSKKVY